MLKTSVSGLVLFGLAAFKIVGLHDDYYSWARTQSCLAKLGLTLGTTWLVLDGPGWAFLSKLSLAG